MTETKNGPPSDVGQPDVERMGPPEDDPGATRWSAGPALPSSTSSAPNGADGSEPDGPASPTDVPRALTNPSRWSRSSFRLAADPDVDAGPPALQNTPALPDPSDRMNADRRRRFVDEPTQPYQMPDPADFEPGPTPPALLTPPEFVSGPLPKLTTPEADAPRKVPLALAFSADAPPAPEKPVEPARPAASPLVASLSAPTPQPAPTLPAQRPHSALSEPTGGFLALSAEVGMDPDPDPAGPFGGRRDYRQAVADRLPRAIRLLMPPPVAAPQSATRMTALEDGRRRSDVELQVLAHRAGREALAAESRGDELRRQAAIARDQAYEARATWQWTAHRRATLAEELQQITGEANSVAEEQRKLSEQARGAMRDVAAWDTWIGQLRDEAARLGGTDGESANARAEQGQNQVQQLRDWLDRAEQRFRQLGAHLEGLSGERDQRVSESVELSARQQTLVDRYKRLGSDAQRMDHEAAGCIAEAIRARLDSRERLIDLVGLRPELSRWVNGAAVALAHQGEIPVGYRRPLLSEHVALEQVLPRNPDGSFVTAPELTSDWLSRLNGVGLLADNSRAQNCVDATLALFDAFVRGRPRVAVPRIVDAHRSGTTRLPLRGETTGRHRLESGLDGSLQILFRQAADVQTPAEAYAVHTAFDLVADQLRQAGHGALAVLVTGWQDGDARTWAAVNHRGGTRWVDPQLGTVSDTPVPAEWIRTLEVLMVDGSARPVPFPGAPLSPWTTRTASTAYATAVTQAVGSVS
ncbi:toxin glutamine deamidase domain-containing protein [Cryptosporangium sp. NPDC051539]|uniref:toxin glutamine deamidase domain-containing protein n=1 Tax=Cryptosporangium sp. NPDC051539 TaxID=3363962 RepID=UPI0037B44495